MSASEEKPVFTTSVAAEILGVHPRTLLVYEKESLILPFRSETNRRLYSEKDVKLLRFIRFLTQDRGVNLKGVKYLLEAIREGEKQKLNLKRRLFPKHDEKEPLF